MTIPVPQYYVEGHHEPIIEPRIWDQVQVELDTRHTLKDRKSGTSKSYLFSSRLVCADCGGWYGRKVWASNTKYRHAVWRCNHRYEGEHRCATATLREEHIQDAFITVLGRLSTQLETPSRMRHALKTAFDTSQLKADIRNLNTTVTSLEEEFARLIEENQTRVQDQGEYLARFEKAEADYQQAQTKKEALETEVRQRASRYKTILAAYEQLLDAGSALVFEPRQFNALIDHASVSAESIQFVFKSGHEIEINLD